MNGVEFAPYMALIGLKNIFLRLSCFEVALLQIGKEFNAALKVLLKVKTVKDTVDSDKRCQNES